MSLSTAKFSAAQSVGYRAKPSPVSVSSTAILPMDTDEGKKHVKLGSLNLFFTKFDLMRLRASLALRDHGELMKLLRGSPASFKIDSENLKKLADFEAHFENGSTTTGA